MNIEISEKDLLNEEWKDIEGFEGLYQVSNMGRVKSLPSSYFTTRGRQVNKKGRVLKPALTGQKESKTRYLGVSLSMNGVVHRYKVHKLVGEAFVPKSENVVNSHIDHIDQNPLNNKAENLQRINCRDNSIKAHIHNGARFLTGVSKTKNGSHFVSKISIKGKVITLGYFDGEQEAHDEYMRVKNEIQERESEFYEELIGDVANLNFR